jgi:hypothetical protein
LFAHVRWCSTPFDAVAQCHRLDLTKEQRDEHIRRYAELIEARLSVQNGPKVMGRPEGPAAIIARQIADATLPTSGETRSSDPKKGTLCGRRGIEWGRSALLAEHSRES